MVESLAFLVWLCLWSFNPSIPVAPAISRAGINLMFIDHFQDMARGHFVVKHLEMKYSKELLNIASLKSSI